MAETGFLADAFVVVMMGGIGALLFRESRHLGAELRAEMRVEIGALRQEMHNELSEFRNEISGFKSEVRADFAEIRTELRDVRSDIAAVRSDLTQVALAVGVRKVSGA